MSSKEKNPRGQCDEHCLDRQPIKQKIRDMIEAEGGDPTELELQQSYHYFLLNNCLGRSGCQAAILEGRETEAQLVPDLGAM